MPRRSTPQSKNDDLAFPVRVKIAVPGTGLGQSLTDAHAWLRSELDAVDYAEHSLPGIACSTAAFYFQTVEAAERFVAAFPELELADGTQSRAFSSPSRPRPSP